MRRTLRRWPQTFCTSLDASTPVAHQTASNRVSGRGTTSPRLSNDKLAAFRKATQVRPKNLQMRSGLRASPGTKKQTRRSTPSVQKTPAGAGSGRRTGMVPGNASSTVPPMRRKWFPRGNRNHGGRRAMPSDFTRVRAKSTSEYTRRRSPGVRTPSCRRFREPVSDP